LAFYNKPYSELLSSKIPPLAKLVYLQCESWYAYNKKQKKECRIYFSQLEKNLNTTTSDLVDSFRQLKLANMMDSYPEKNSIIVTSMHTIPDPEMEQVLNNIKEREGKLPWEN